MKGILSTLLALVGLAGSLFGQNPIAPGGLTAPASSLPSQTFVFDNVLDQTNLTDTIDHSIEDWFYQPNVGPEDWWWTFDAALGKPPKRIGMRLPELPAAPTRVTFNWRIELYRDWRWENLADWSIPGAQLRYHWRPRFNMLWRNYGNPVELTVTNLGIMSGDDPSTHGGIWPALGPFDGVIDGAGPSGTTYSCPGDCVLNSMMTYFMYNLTTEYPVAAVGEQFGNAWKQGAVLKFDSDLIAYSGYSYDNGGPNPAEVADVPLFNTHQWATEWSAHATVDLVITVHYD
jgi:hypothetical protein